MDEPITKRLHVSGLTPSITLADLSTRLGMYGSITSLDKFGEVDALGQPRKFAYVTLETTKGKLGKCMNVLSGSTWKGAKLRIGEAKPDFRERIVRENAPTEPSDRPKKRPRLARGVQGVHAPSMDPITPSTVEEYAHKGWYVTPLGRLIRPMRMRPARPLDPPVIATPPKDKKEDKRDREKKKGKVAKDGEGEGEGDEKKKTKKRKKVPDVRARRKTIDPVKYGSTHVIGAFLGGGEGAGVAQNTPPVEDEVSDSEESSSSSSEEEEEDDHNAKNDHPDTALKHAQPSVQPPPPTVLPLPKSTIPVLSLAQSPPPPQSPATDITPGDELTAEKLKSLNLLRSMFGEDEGQEDWGGAESMSDVDMDVDVDGNEPRGMAADGDGEAYEVVRRDGGAKLREGNIDVDDEAEGDEEEEEEETEEDEEPSQTENGTQEKKGQPGVQITKLKDLFAPREEEAGFSLLGHLDLELDEDMDFEFGLPSLSTAAPSTIVTTTTAAAPISSLTTPSIIPTHQKTGTSQQTLTLDPSLPLFFPTTSQTGPRNVPTNMRPGAWKDMYGFYRTDDEATIRQRWEESKGELTREWKRRYREGLKRRRRRGGGVGDVD